MGVDLLGSLYILTGVATAAAGGAAGVGLLGSLYILTGVVTTVEGAAVGVAAVAIGVVAAVTEVFSSNSVSAAITSSFFTSTTGLRGEDLLGEGWSGAANSAFLATRSASF